MINLYYENNPEAILSERQPQQVGFRRGLRPEKIVGVTKEDGITMYMIAWHGSRYTDMVSSEQAQARCPKLVITFLESLIFVDSE